MDLEDKIAGLLGDFSKLSPRIKHLSFNTDTCGDRVDVRCSYISFRDGQPTFDDFVEMLADHIISFCLPRSEIGTAQKEIAAATDHFAASRVMRQLTDKARGLFIKAKKGSHRSGEAGEIVLYILKEWLLQAPHIVSKMYLKTNNQMPVYGTDGIYARYDAKTKRLLLYWGESKAHVKISSALTSALDSISEFVTEEHEKREIDIVAAYADFDGLDKESKEAILRYLDPYAEESNERVVTHSCLLIFEYTLPDGTDSGKAESLFLKQVSTTVESFIKTIKASVEAKGLGPQRFEFFLMPVPSVQTFRDKFQQKIGWPDD